MPAGHRHIIFTIPKMLRAYLKRNRKLNGILFEAATFAIKTYFEEESCVTGCTSGIILYLQTFGNTGNYNSHLHGLIT